MHLPKPEKDHEFYVKIVGDFHCEPTVENCTGDDAVHGDSDDKDAELWQRTEISEKCMCNHHEFQDHRCVYSDKFVKDILSLCGRWLAEARKTAEKQPIASSSMPSPSTEAEGQSSENQERLAKFDYIEMALKMCILNSKCSKVYIQHRLPVEDDYIAFAFQSELLAAVGCGEKVNGMEMLHVAAGGLMYIPHKEPIRHFSLFESYKRHTASSAAGKTHKETCGNDVVNEKTNRMWFSRFEKNDFSLKGELR
ncbi:unnamed protein product [Hymenolepis diminuta]|uniref:Mos1 transposase HTH domain-containing protein n=1 Tax=Hymenolepis diminuta TaxID=6216 RepID=A0A564XX35_HYMDI|nr:unnamed protein product [Hymenolepis diminuta]